LSASATAGKKTPQPVEQQTKRVQQARVEYWYKAKQMAPGQFVFVDESGSKCVMTPRYGWGPVGERVDGIYAANWGESITLLGAMGLDGIRAMMTVNGGTTGDVFHAFVEQLLLPRLRPDDVVVWDGLSSHGDSRVLELLAQAQVKLLPLPPYSPDLNPIESCCSKIKHWVRKLQPRSRDQLDAAVAHAMKRVSPDDAHGWYAEAGYV
jgi:transposase